MQLVYGKGVSAPSGIANSVEKRFTFTVREPFSANFSCERENAQSACLPIRPMSLNFNAPVPRKLAEAIRLKSIKDTLKPTFKNDSGSGNNMVNSISFGPVFAEQTKFSIELTRDFKDESGRELSNADNFPLAVSTGAMPPLAKFAASPFGIVERYAEPGTKPGDPALLSVTLRNVEMALKIKGLTPGVGGKVSDMKATTDADIIAWFRKVQRYNAYEILRKTAEVDVKGPLPKALNPKNTDYVQTRMVSLLAGQSNVKTLDLPKTVNTDPRLFASALLKSASAQRRTNWMCPLRLTKKVTPCAVKPRSPSQ